MMSSPSGKRTSAVRPPPSTFLRDIGLVLTRALALLALLASGSAARAATAPNFDLFAHGSDQTLWVAQVVKTSTGEKTAIRYRAVGQPQWQELVKLNGRAIDLANHDTSLAVLMEGDDWLLVWPGGFSSGPALPAGYKPIAFASERDLLLAIGRSSGAAATTQPSTSQPAATQTMASVVASQPAATSQPTTAPAAERLAVFSFDGASWQMLAELPENFSPHAGGIELAIVDRAPLVAVAREDNAVRTLGLQDKRWVDRGTVALGFVPRQFKVLGGQQPILWAAGEGGPGALYYRGAGGQWSGPKPLMLSRQINLPRSRTVVLASGHIRLLFADENDSLFEQAYNVTDASPVGPIAELAPPRPLISPVYGSWSMAALLLAVLLMMIGTMRRGPIDMTAGPDAAPLAVARLLPRVLAGLLDLAPAVAVGVILRLVLPKSLTSAAQVPWAGLAGTVTYLGYTALTEIFLGRTPGKILLGLRVVGIDGQAPGPAALLVRNLLRLVDCFPLFPLAALVFFSPLRQRFGDLAAGTVVIGSDVPKGDDDPGDEEGESARARPGASARDADRENDSRDSQRGVLAGKGSRRSDDDDDDADEDENANRGGRA